MPPNFNEVQKPHKKIKVIIISVAAVLIVSAGVIIGLIFLKKYEAINAVKQELTTAATSMKSSFTKDGAYPATITDILKSSNSDIKMTGSSSFNGTSYCIAGTSLSNSSIVYHIDSNSITPQSGSCTTGKNISSPAMPGDVAVVFTSGSSINVSWASAVYATNYILECATDENFSNIASTIKTTDTNASCSNLKSNTGYYGRVKATNSAGESTWSSTIHIDTLNV